MGNISSVYEHPVLLQLSVMIDIKLSFLGLCHQVQTYLSYCQLQTLLSPAWVCPWDTITCGAQLCSSVRGPRQARSWQSALSDGRSLPKPTSGASIYSRTRQQWPLTLQDILFIIPVSCSSTFFSLFCVFTVDYQWESCRKCNSLRGKKMQKEEKKYSWAFFSPVIYYWTEQDWKYYSKVIRHLRNRNRSLSFPSLSTQVVSIRLVGATNFCLPCQGVCVCVCIHLCLCLLSPILRDLLSTLIGMLIWELIILVV